MEMWRLDTGTNEGLESCSGGNNLSLDANVPLDQEAEYEILKILKEFGVEQMTKSDAFDPVVQTARQSSTVNSISPSYAMVLPYLETTTEAQRSTSESGSKLGLRNFSKTVMEKIKKKKVTSFEKIAEEMFSELIKEDPEANTEYMKKNVRRRVYDVLNVMVAMEMVLKKKREITWVEPPSGVPEEQQMLQQEKIELEKSIQQKTADLKQLILEMISYKNLVKTKQNTRAPQTSQKNTSAIYLPFIAVRTSKNTVITHATSNENLEHVFNFDQPFEIHDNMEVLIRMGMAFGLERNMCSQTNLEISKKMVPKVLEPYLVELAKSGQLKPSCSRTGKVIDVAIPK